MSSKNFLPAFSPTETQSPGRNKVNCEVRGKEVPATPEEKVRQRVLRWLIHEKKWKRTNLRLEHAYKWESDFNRSYIRPDIEMLDDGGQVLVVVECKHENVPLSKKVDDQAIEYAIKSGAKYIWVTNGEEHRFLVPDTHSKWKAVSSIEPIGETYEPPTGELVYPEVGSQKDVERYFSELLLEKLNCSQLAEERDFTLALYKVIFEVANNRCLPYSYEGVHLLESLGVSFHEFSNRSGGSYYNRYADFVAATRGRVEAMSIAVNMWGDGEIRLCVGASKTERKHHALQLDFAKCVWNEGMHWDIYHDGRMSSISNAVILEAVRESNCGHWIEMDDDGKQWIYLGSLPKAKSVTWGKSKKFLARLLHYGIIRTNLREAQH